MNDKASVIDVTDLKAEKAEMTLSPRMQGLPPTPTGSNISRSFQDKLQQRLTRVRDASSILAEDNSGESSKDSEGFHVRRRDPVEEIRRANDDTRTSQDPPEDGPKPRKSFSPSRRNQKQRTSEETTQSSLQHQVESAKVDDPSESERLAALALAEKLRLRATELKEKRRKNNGNRAAGASSQMNKSKSQRTQILV
jgi:hypothetical protein